VAGVQMLFSSFVFGPTAIIEKHLFPSSHQQRVDMDEVSAESARVTGSSRRIAVSK